MLISLKTVAKKLFVFRAFSVEVGTEKAATAPFFLVSH